MRKFWHLKKEESLRMDEKELLSYYKHTGNISVLGKLYSPYMSLLYGVCLKYLQDEEQSQDAVMQIFEELINKLRKHDVDNFKSWLYVYARNFCLMEIRMTKNLRHVDIENHLFESEQKMSVEEITENWEEKDFENLEGCLATLKPEQEQCIRLFYLEKKCYKTIEKQTGYDIKKVKSYIQNGKRNLKICMENQNGK